jgi:hypothetical protein
LDYLVVARYNESIKWLFRDFTNCIIYNKGEKLNINNEIILQNVGRESETYLQHIIKNYDNLSDITIFTQGNISDHRRGGLDYLYHIKDQADKLGKCLPNLSESDKKNIIVGIVILI